ncbi:MAG: DinB family protein [Bacteroidetes bacterium]|nr:DinB family protein [Bacteroidota bacterium]MCW5894900.1 DinB family protein [Bacteroidota bacterium]
MTLLEIKTLHAYNAWASNQIFDVLATMPTGQYMQDMKASHGSIHNTLVHMVGAEKVWLERFQGAAQPFLSENPPPSLAEVKTIWGKTGFDTAKWLGAQSDKSLQGTFTMKTAKGDSYTHVFWQTFQHVVNHSTYHRGQIITMMRQHGVKPPSTDLIRFYREVKPG